MPPINAKKKSKTPTIPKKRPIHPRNLKKTEIPPKTSKITKVPLVPETNQNILNYLNKTKIPP